MVFLEGNTAYLVLAMFFLGFSILFSSFFILKLIRKTEELIDELKRFPNGKLPEGEEEEVGEEARRLGTGAILVLALLSLLYFLAVAIFLYLTRPVGW